MEVMEDGNLMDKVTILIQRDMEYYKAKQTVLQEIVCPGIIGGKLDFPRSASFAAIKLAVWWEDEYVAAYRKSSGFFQNSKENRDNSDTSGACGGIARSSDPTKFLSTLSKSADQLLEHLHVLTQEALDHADLTVLTGTIGAAALLKNCLWFYIQTLNDLKSSSSIALLQNGYKKYNEMCEALAERLLDLHCRLLSLYILQDSDSLDWDNEKPFFESERGSYVIQMWWLYMQGTKEDLWNTVPPKMAQRVFSGMLNESLTILTVRYTQSVPSEARSFLLLVDISNLLLCVAQLLPSICDSAADLANFPNPNNKSKILKDIHVKCQELFSSFLLRGASLDSLNKVFKKDSIRLYNKPSLAAPIPWITFALPNIFKNVCFNSLPVSNKNKNSLLGLDLMVLLSQPQPNWALLLKVLCNKKFLILNLLFNEYILQSNLEMKRIKSKSIDCGNLLCPADGSCKHIDSSTKELNYYDLILSISEVFLCVANEEELKEYFVGVITKRTGWSKPFERSNVWNQIRPAWYEAILNIVSPILPLVEETVISALRTGATMYQAMSLILACFSLYWDMLDSSLVTIAKLFQDAIPSNVAPMSDSVLVQILVSALYSKLIATSQETASTKKAITFQDLREDKSNKPFCKDEALTASFNIALAVAESLCSIDEDNKHTDQIEELLNQANNNMIFSKAGSERVENDKQMTEIVASDLLSTSEGKKSLKTLYYVVNHNSDWIYFQLGISDKPISEPPNKACSQSEPLLYKTFHIGSCPFDQLLTKQLKPHWPNLLQAPMGLTAEKVWTQLSCRWEFQNSVKLSMHDADIVNYLSLMIKQ